MFPYPNNPIQPLPQPLPHVHPAQTYPYFCKVVLGTNWQTLRFHHAFLEEEMRGGIDGVASSLQNITVASSLFLGISFVVLLEGDTLASRTAAAMVATMFVIMSICGFWFSVLLSTMIVIALNQMDTSEEATVYLMRLSSLIGVPFTLLNYSGFVLFAGIFLWMWDAKVGGGGTELSAEDLGPWFAAFIVEFVLFGVVGTLPTHQCACHLHALRGQAGAGHRADGDVRTERRAERAWVRSGPRGASRGDAGRTRGLPARMRRRARRTARLYALATCAAGAGRHVPGGREAAGSHHAPPHRAAVQPRDRPQARGRLGLHTGLPVQGAEAPTPRPR